MTLRKVRLELSHDDLQTITHAANPKRGNTAKLPADTLRKLLVDHTRLVQYVRDRGDLEGIL